MLDCGYCQVSFKKTETEREFHITHAHPDKMNTENYFAALTRRYGKK